MSDEDVLDVLENIIISKFRQLGDGEDDIVSELMGSFYRYFAQSIGSVFEFTWYYSNKRISFSQDFKTTVRHVWKISDDDIIRVMLEKCI